VTHARQQIRDAIEAEMKTIGAFGTAVYTSRTKRVDDADLPALLIYTKEEQSQRDSTGSPPIMLRTPRIQLEALARVNDTLDDTLDDLAAAIEVKMQADPTFGGLVLDLMLEETEISLKSEGDKQHGSVRLSYQVLYRTPENNPETII